LPVVHATYLFESRISLLLRISQRPEYANKLIDFAIMETMKELTFLDERLPHNVSQDEDNGDRTSYEKYNSLLLMVIRLIVSILTAIGHESGSVLGKATGFVASHQGMMADIFTDFIPLSALTSNNKTARTRCIKHLEVLCEVTALFYYLGSKIDSVDKA
ncbi:9899_t:CDS:2, partial [Paraglomus occultum]